MGIISGCLVGGRLPEVRSINVWLVLEGMTLKHIPNTCHFWWDCIDVQTSNMTDVLKLLHHYTMNYHIITCNL